MCRIYAGTDPAHYEPVTRSLRLHGAVTSIRLEARFWAILDEMAQGDGVTTPTDRLNKKPVSSVVVTKTA